MLSVQGAAQIRIRQQFVHTMQTAARVLFAEGRLCWTQEKGPNDSAANDAFVVNGTSFVADYGITKRYIATDAANIATAYSNSEYTQWDFTVYWDASRTGTYIVAENGN